MQFIKDMTETAESAENWTEMKVLSSRMKDTLDFKLSPCSEFCMLSSA